MIDLVKHQHQRNTRLHLVRAVYCSEASRGFATATGHHPHPSATAFLPGRDFATTDIPPSRSGVRRARATISAPGEPLGHHSIVQEKPKSVGEFIHTANPMDRRPKSQCPVCGTCIPVTCSWTPPHHPGANVGFVAAHTLSRHGRTGYFLPCIPRTR